MLLSGKEPSNSMKRDAAVLSEKFEKNFSRKPCLAVVFVGSNPASTVYVRNKKKACEETGMGHLDVDLDENISEEALIEKVKALNSDSNVDGILVQLPLPKHINVSRVLSYISAEKDVDGFSAENLGKLLTEEKGLVACTPKGILYLLDYYNIETEGKNVVVVGRSRIVGKPIAALLEQKCRNATVTLCHSSTKNLDFYLKNADIVICAVGKAHVISEDMVKKDAVVIDVGTNRVPDASKKSGYALQGDFCYSAEDGGDLKVTPVPGGVGLMTVSSLMDNTLIAACRRMGIEKEDL
ncbi:MAG: bifunctional 5,10-methylenetetrahydrofolate dehydrogenase/5,10-methenyltetrahydrofolate cyclohydrolase [Sphaerochaetaceae bacterium]|nr:bifunctional 5,10-methylenetetrahydrofolate dehydrogenase/5,10-methenyltetrahydrofolate cyclohydrolase [Sphaerochaetaceae bacterium]